MRLIGWSSRISLKEKPQFGLLCFFAEVRAASYSIVWNLRKARKNLEYSPSSDGIIISVPKPREPDCVVTPAIVSSEFNRCVESAAASVSAMD